MSAVNETDFWSLTPRGWIYSSTLADKPTDTLITIRKHATQSCMYAKEYTNYYLELEENKTYDWEYIRQFVIKYKDFSDEYPLSHLLDTKFNSPGTYSFSTNGETYEGIFTTRDEAFEKGIAALRRRTINGICLHTRKDISLSWEDISLQSLEIDYADTKLRGFTVCKDNISSGSVEECVAIHSILRQAVLDAHANLKKIPCPFKWHVCNIIHLSEQEINCRMGEYRHWLWLKQGESHG